MNIPFLPAINLRTFKGAVNGLDQRLLSYLNCVHALISPDNLDAALQHLSDSLGIFETSFDVATITSLDDVVSLLDAGACRIFVTEHQYEQLRHNYKIEPSRLVLLFDINAPQSLLKAIESKDLNISIQNVSSADALVDILGNNLKDNLQNRSGIVYAQLSKSNSENALALSKTLISPILSAEELTISNAQTSQVPVVDLLMANATSDRPDSLITTLVTDERGIALGLVYSSKESVSESLRTGRGVYQSRKRGLWYKGDSSGDVQELVKVSFDCDSDCLRFVVHQKGKGFCHLGAATCFGHYQGLSKLEKTLQHRKESAPQGSYTSRLFNDSKLLNAKIKEEAEELCEATDKSHVAFEAADLLYFALTKCVSAGVSLEDVEKQLDAKSFKVKRRPGDAKPKYTNGTNSFTSSNVQKFERKEAVKEAASIPKSKDDPAGVENGKILMKRYSTAEVRPEEIKEILQRPSQRSSETIMGIVRQIVDDVRTRGDKALLEYTHKFEKATSLQSPVVHAPFAAELMQLPAETIEAIDVSYNNIYRFHAAQKEEKPLTVETMPGVVCSRFVRPIERVGLYIPGGTAVLPSTALMLGVPAKIAGCKKIVLASPPRADGSVTPEIVYIAHKIGAESIVLAGGSQAIAALAYGTESISKVDKIFGPGNQFVTAGKMLVSNDTSAGVSIDMPAGPSEVLVVADSASNPAFVASDLLSQAEHGTDSQVVLIAVGMTSAEVSKIENELHAQASALPRVDIVRGAINNSVTLQVGDIDEAMALVNQYAPEHLIIQTAEPDKAAEMVQHAGSVFIGPWTPESVGDYSAGVNHSLPTYGYARQYSGVNLASYVKHITSSKLTQDGLRNVGAAVMQLAKVEELEAHRRAVSIRLAHMDQTGRGY